MKLDIPEGYEFFGIDDDNKIVLTKKQPQYPKTFEECATKWIDVNDRLPGKGEEVLVAMKESDGRIYVCFGWRPNHNLTTVDKNGFRIHQPLEVEVLAWMPLPKYIKP